MFDHSSMMFPETAHFSGRVVHRDIESLAHYWKTKKHQLSDDETYLRTTIENNIDNYQVVELL